MEQFQQLQQLIVSNQIGSLRMQLTAMNVVDIAAFMEELNPEQCLLVFRVLPKNLSADVFSYLPTQMQEHIVASISDKEVRHMVEDLFLDDTVDFLEEVPANIVKKVMRNVDAETRMQLQHFLRYPKDSAGSLMTVEFVELHDRLTVRQALAKVREVGGSMATVNTIYTIDNTHHLTGTIKLLDLIKNSEEVQITDIRNEQVISVYTGVDQEKVAAEFRKYDLSEMPVVDNEGRLVGLITVDDIVDVIQEENTEDMEIMAAISPTEKEYLKTGVIEMAKKRVPWLLVLMVSATITGRIITRFEEVLQSAVVLAAFIPMLMDTGGNCGSQSSVMVTRGLALDEISIKDTLRVWGKELGIGIVVGIILSAVNFARIMIFEGVGTMVALSVSLSLLVTVICAKCMGGLMPLLAKALRLDPAVMAGPLITTIVDAISLLVFFSFSTVLLGI